MIVHRRVTSSIKFAGTHLYTWVHLGGKRYCESEVSCPRTQHNDPARMLDTKTSALTVRPSLLVPSSSKGTQRGYPAIKYRIPFDQKCHKITVILSLEQQQSRQSRNTKKFEMVRKFIVSKCDFLISSLEDSLGLYKLYQKHKT